MGADSGAGVKGERKEVPASKTSRVKWGLLVPKYTQCR